MPAREMVDWPNTDEEMQSVERRWMDGWMVDAWLVVSDRGGRLVEGSRQWSFSQKIYRQKNGRQIHNFGYCSTVQFLYILHTSTG